jgi:hypothetical protein
MALHKRKMRMRRLALLAALTSSVLIGANAVAYAQVTFAIPFKFDAAGKSLPPGDYTIAEDKDGAITLRLAAKADVSVVLTGVTGKLPQPQPAITEPQLVFDMVGNFEPSYTEYVTDYVLAEVWLPGRDGLLILKTKRSQQHKIIKGQNKK